MAVIRCDAEDVPEPEQFDLKQRHGNSVFFERYLITTDSDMKPFDITDSGCFPRINNPDPDKERKAFLKRVDIEPVEGQEGRWKALLYWLPATAQG